MPDVCSFHVPYLIVFLVKELKFTHILAMEREQAFKLLLFKGLHWSQKVFSSEYLACSFHD